jgi:tetratricopeptide (TPR) repeat protein
MPRGRTQRQGTHPRAGSGPAPSGGDWSWLATIVLPAILVASTLVAYHPAWHGGLLWDDDGHVTPAALQSTAGLWRIWFEVGATQQYYPVLHSAFWAMHRLWGDNPFGYHIVSAVLHACSACLLALILRRLRVRGAVLAAFIFALHPVHAESVAWISEMKNTLSGVCGLGAAFVYLRFDATRERRAYVLAAALFTSALLSKTAVAPLPVALLAIMWWQRGRLRWRGDVWPLAPFFVLGAAAGVLTAWVERTFIGARGAEFTLSAVERGLLAGRAFWFYLSKLAWPENLVFIYPRWHIDPGSAWQYVFPVGVLTLLLALWRMRARSRAPLASLVIFGVMLAPASGVVSVFPFRYSFVADHFQYLASTAVIALFASTVVAIGQRTRLQARWFEAAATLALAVPLAVMTSAQSRQYADAETLYRTTIRANPSAWLAHNNLGVILQSRGHVEEAVAAYQRAVQAEPTAFEAHQNLGSALQQLGRLDDAVSHVTTALQIRPASPEAHNALGAALHRLGRFQEAAASFREALRLEPDYPAARANLGTTLEALGHPDLAMPEYEKAVALEPASAQAHYRYADALRRGGRGTEAIVEYQAALQLDPTLAEAHNTLGLAMEVQGRLQEALSHFEHAVALLPQSAPIQNNVGRILLRLGRLDAAEARLRHALLLQAGNAQAHRNLGDLLVRKGRAAEAVSQYEEALRYQPDSAETHGNLGVALAGVGQIARAVAQFREAVRLDPAYALARTNLDKALPMLRKSERR